MTLVPDEIERRYIDVSSNDIDLTPGQRMIAEDLETLRDLLENAVPKEDYDAAVEEARELREDVDSYQAWASDIDLALREFEDLYIDEIEEDDRRYAAREALIKIIDKLEHW